MFTLQDLLLVSLCAAMAVPEMVNIVGPKVEQSTATADQGLSGSTASESSASAGSQSIVSDSSNPDDCFSTECNPAIDYIPRQANAQIYEGNIAFRPRAAFSDFTNSFRDSCYGNSNCINGNPAGYFEYGAIPLQSYGQGAYSSGYSSSLSGDTSLRQNAYGADYGSAYAS